MLAKSGPIPRVAGWSFEPKLDGFRCLICTHGGRYRARSRRGWDMTALLPELASLPADVQLDGEIVAVNEDGYPDFHQLSARVLHKARGISVRYYACDVLACDGGSVTHLQYSERRDLLEALEVDGPHPMNERQRDRGNGRLAAARKTRSVFVSCGRSACRRSTAS